MTMSLVPHQVLRQHLSGVGTHLAMGSLGTLWGHPGALGTPWGHVAVTTSLVPPQGAQAPPTWGWAHLAMGSLETLWGHLGTPSCPGDTWGHPGDTLGTEFPSQK